MKIKMITGKSWKKDYHGVNRGIRILTSTIETSELKEFVTIRSRRVPATKEAE